MEFAGISLSGMGQSWGYVGMGLKAGKQMTSMVILLLICSIFVFCNFSNWWGNMHVFKIIKFRVALCDFFFAHSQVIDKNHTIAIMEWSK